jgi:hypothetical protein
MPLKISGSALNHKRIKRETRERQEGGKSEARWTRERQERQNAYLDAVCLHGAYVAQRPQLRELAVPHLHIV